jgi:hypothetical protein
LALTLHNPGDSQRLQPQPLLLIPRDNLEPAAALSQHPGGKLPKASGADHQHPVRFTNLDLFDNAQSGGPW